MTDNNNVHTRITDVPGIRSSLVTGSGALLPDLCVSLARSSLFLSDNTMGLITMLLNIASH
jgi:hypothetical protein